MAPFEKFEPFGAFVPIDPRRDFYKLTNLQLKSSKWYIKMKIRMSEPEVELLKKYDGAGFDRDRLSLAHNCVGF